MNRFHPSNLRRLIIRGIKFFFQLDVILFLVVNFVVMALLQIHFFSFGTTLGILFAVPILMFQYVPGVAFVMAIVFGYAIYRNGVRKSLGTFTRLVFGSGWDAWAMFWMWVILFTFMPDLLVGSMDAGSIYRLYVSNVAILIGLTIFQNAARKARAFPKREAVIAIITTVVLSVAFGEFIQPLLREASTSLTIHDSLSFASILSSGISIAVMLFVISRRIGFGIGLRIIALVTMGSVAINIILFRPVYDWIFLNFVPTTLLDTISVDSGLMQAFVTSAAIMIGIGALSAIVVRSSSIRGRILIGALVGALIGLSVSAVVGGWAAGTAGQSSLYGFVLSRVGYNDAEWLLKLAVAINDTLSLTILESFTSAIVGSILAGLGGLVVPIHRASQAAPDGLPLWTIFALMTIPLLQLGILVIAVVLNLLAPALNNILVPYNVQPFWKPDWTAPAMTAVMFAVELGLAVGLRRWIYRTHVQTHKPANVVFLNTLFISGLFLALAGFLQFISVSIWWSLLVSVVAIVIGIELMSISRELPKDKQALRNRRRWVGAGMLSGMFVIVLNWVMIAAALSLVMISVVLIVDLSKTTEPPPGITYLLDQLELHIAVQSNILSLFLQYFIVIIGFISCLLVLNIPANLLDAFMRIGQMIYNRLPNRMQNDSVLKGIGFGAVALVDLSFIGYPLLSSLYVIVFLRRDHLLRIPFWLQAGLLSIVGAFLGGVALQIELVGLAETVVVYIVGLSVVISYYLVGLYTSPTQKYWRTLSFSVGLSFVISIVALLQVPNFSGYGGISKNTDGNWTILNQDNSTLGTNLPTAILARQDGSMWFANSGGILSIYDNDSWQLASVSEILDSIRDQVDTSDLLTQITQQTPYLLERTDGTVWYASGREIGRVAVNPQGIGAYSLESICDDSVIQFTETSDATFCNGIANSEYRDYESLVITDDGDLWFTTDGIAYRLVAGEVVALPFESIPIGLPSFELTPTATATMTETPNTIDNDVLVDTVSTSIARQSANTEIPTPTLTTTPTRVPYAIDAEAPLKEIVIDIIVNDITTSADDVWLATNMGLYHFADEASEPEVVAVESQNVSLVEFSDGIVWYVTANGIHRFNNGESELATPAATIQSLIGTTQITALTADGTTGIIWIGTNRGLIRYVDVDDTVVYTSENSGLVVNHILSIVSDSDGNVWVSTYESTESTASIWIPLLIVAGFWTFFGGGFYTDHNNTPGSRGKRIAKSMADSADKLAEEIHNYLASDPHAESIEAAISQLNQEGLPYGGVLLGALNKVISAEAPNVEAIISALGSFPASVATTAISAYYKTLRDAIDVHSVADIASLEVRISPGDSSGIYKIVTRNQQLQSIPSFVALQPSTQWNTLQNISIIAGKFGQVDDTGDRLSYLAGALVEIESAQAQLLTAPLTTLDLSVFRSIINRWRSIIADTINSLSGRADLRVELRTRQIKRDETTSLALMLENVGQSAAENIRINLIDGSPTATATEVNSVRLERLSPNRKETVEYAIAVPQAESTRVVFAIMWDDRLEKDKSIEFADQIRFFETQMDFAPIENPYIVGHPVKQAEMFFGRDDVFQFINENLTGSVQDRTIVLYGQRRTGKTSLLYQLINGRLGEKYLAILVDMQAVVLLVESTADLLGEILYQISIRLEDDNISVDVPTIDASTPSPLRVFDRFITRLGKALGERRILLIFDEFELIESEIQSGTLDSNLLGYFRSLIQHRDSLVFIFAGTHRLDEMSHDYWSILFNIALSCQITFMTEKDTISLIRQPVSDQLLIDDLAVEKIMRLTNGHPYFTQLLCWALVNHCNTAQHNYATINDVNRAIDLILTTGESHFAYIWQQSNLQEQLILAIMAHGANSTSWLTLDDIMSRLEGLGVSRYSNSDLIKILDPLVQNEIIEVTVISSTRYRFVLDILRIWVRHNRSVETIVERLKHN